MRRSLFSATLLSILLTMAVGSAHAAGLVKTIVTPDAEVAYLTRLRAAHSLGDSLSEADILLLYRFLDRKINDDVLPSLKFNALKNDVVSALMGQTVYPSGLGQQLIKMFHDTSHDATWRDYCIQFLASCCKKATRSSERERIIDTLWEATELDSNSAGTALISLLRIGEAVDSERLAKTAYALASNEDTPSAVRITAIQVCANLGNSEVLPLSRSLAETTETHIPLRISAIAAIGILGDGSDLALLQALEEDGSNRLRIPTQSAIEKIEQRIH